MREFGKWAAIAGIGATAITCIIVMGSVVKTSCLPFCRNSRPVIA